MVSVYILMNYLDIFVNKKSSEPLYYQLYSQLISLLRGGEIKDGEKLPGKRSAATQLGVSVNTVDMAYQMLAAEGYVEAKERSGFWVCKLQNQLILPEGKFAAPVEVEADNSYMQNYKYSFATGGLNESLFPRKIWARLMRETLNEASKLFSRGHGQGEAELREQIAKYLRAFRGVSCTARQVVVGAGLEVLIGMFARLLPNSVFALEDPGYNKMTRIVSNMGLKWCGVPVDAMGINPDALKRSGADIAYITPSHQYPSGAVMPAPRRGELLNWATQAQRYIIEDDHDSEFRFNGRPLPSLQGLDSAGKVVYAGTFSRSLAQGLRVAYLVLPKSILQLWQAAYKGYSCTVSRLEQHTLAGFIAGGHFARSLNTARNTYRTIRDNLIEALQAVLPVQTYSLENTHTGLYFILRTEKTDAAFAAKRARQRGIEVRALSEYALSENSPKELLQNALVLGYGGLQKEEIPAAAKALAGVL